MVAWLLQAIEDFYRIHAGLLVIVGIAVALVIGGLQILLAYVSVARTKKGTGDYYSLPIDPTIRTALLDKVQTEWVHDRLHQGLRNAIRVDLKLTAIPTAVQPRLRAYALTASAQREERETNGTILEIFNGANGRLLILGAPGTGKTNLLMELAQGLIEDARTHQTSPIPVIFNLPRWTLGRNERSLADWFIDELTLDGLSRLTATAVVRQNRILPLLDALDEVAEERRASCVEAIHAYQQERDLPKLAICCRLTEYEQLPKLNLRAAVRVEKLTREDVERYLSMEKLAHVGRVLEEDPELWTIMDTPLCLDVAVLTADVETWAEEQRMLPRDRLYARFVKYAIGREMEGSPRKQTGPTQLLQWLGWLAAEMKRRDQSQFSFEQLDDSWLPKKRAVQWIVRASAALGTGLAVGLAAIATDVFTFRPRVRLAPELVHALKLGLRDGLVAGFLFGLLGALLGARSARDQPIERLIFAWRRWREALVGMLHGAWRSGLVTGRFVGLVATGLFALAGLIENPLFGKLGGKVIARILSAIAYGLRADWPAHWCSDFSGEFSGR